MQRQVKSLEKILSIKDLINHLFRLQSKIGLILQMFQMVNITYNFMEKVKKEIPCISLVVNQRHSLLRIKNMSILLDSSTPKETEKTKSD